MDADAEKGEGERGGLYIRSAWLVGWSFVFDSRLRGGGLMEDEYKFFKIYTFLGVFWRFFGCV